MATSELDKAIGFDLGDQPISWNRRDLLLYAVGIGCKTDDLQFVYELDKRFAAFPTYPVALPLKGDTEDVNLFSEQVSSRGRAVPGLPKFDPNRVVHGTQSIEIVRPLPLSSGKGWVFRRRITGIHENKSGVLVDQENVLVDPQGVEYSKCYSTAFHVGAKITGSRFSKTVSDAKQPAPAVIPKDKKQSPDKVIRDQTSTEQAIVYRLTADYNPLHIDPRIGKAAGFGGVILHGLCTYGFAARAVLSSVNGSETDPNALRYFGARFTSPVRPGDTLETSIWEVGSAPGGEAVLAFETRVVETGKVVIGGGTAIVRKGAESGKSKSKL